jgi:hypothetical protein
MCLAGLAIAAPPLVAMVHDDTGRIGVYEPAPGSADDDGPMAIDDKPVVRSLKAQ